MPRVAILLTDFCTHAGTTVNTLAQFLDLLNTFELDIKAVYLDSGFYDAKMLTLLQVTLSGRRRLAADSDKTPSISLWVPDRLGIADPDAELRPQTWLAVDAS